MPVIQSEITSFFTNHKWRLRVKTEWRRSMSLSLFKYDRSSMTDGAQYGHVWSYKPTTPYSLQPPYRTTPVENNTVQLLISLLNADRRWTARESAAEVGVCHKTVLHILHVILGYWKLAGRWKFPRSTMAPLCSRTDLVGPLPKVR